MNEKEAIESDDFFFIVTSEPLSEEELDTLWKTKTETGISPVSVFAFYGYL